MRFLIFFFQVGVTLTKSGSKIVYKDLPLDDPTNKKPDITKAKNILYWKPMYNLEKGLVKNYTLFQKIFVKVV